jgi:hypothetical protein
MDVSDASYYIQENTKINVAKWGTPKKNNKKIFCVTFVIWDRLGESLIHSFEKIRLARHYN